MAASDWINVVCAVIAAIVGILTLGTVYIAAEQIASKSRIYKQGMSMPTLGPWKSKVKKRTIMMLGLQKSIQAPTVSLPFLVSKKWTPSFTFPLGYSKENGTSCVEAADNNPANATWVNFMQALGVSTENEDLYVMEDAPELENGVVPMHWKGKDLVGMCSMLGFQSARKKPPSFKLAMPLPMQWSGPLGWVQFRSSPNGCIAQFRTRMPMHEQIAEKFHSHWNDFEVPSEFQFIKSRLWNSIAAFCVKDDKTLFLGGANRQETVPEDDEGIEAPADQRLLQKLTSSDLSEDDIMLQLLGKKVRRIPAALRGKASEGKVSTNVDDERDIPDFLRSSIRRSKDKVKNQGKVQLLRPCPGLLSIIAEGELAYSRGLQIKENCLEYDRKYTNVDDIDHTLYPYHLGKLYMDQDLLTLMKEAVLLLVPDGFYFSPAAVLCLDLHQVYKHLRKMSKRKRPIFRLPDAAPPGHERLWNAMALCNGVQETRNAGHAVFSVKDMRLFSQACRSLTVLTTPADEKFLDLVWAMLCCPELPRDISEALCRIEFQEFLKPGAADATYKDGVLDCSEMFGCTEEKGKKYEIPLVGDGTFKADLIFAAFADAFIRFFWIDSRWITDVAMYDSTIPQSVIMC